MKTKNYIRNSWASVLFMLFAWMPMKGMAQAKLYELVVEKTDGSERAFKITGNHPYVFYENQEGVNTLVVAAVDDMGFFPCSEVKRLFTREKKEVNIIDVMNYIKGSPSDNIKIEDVDINGDGIVNVADIIMIVNMIIGI